MKSTVSDCVKSEEHSIWLLKSTVSDCVKSTVSIDVRLMASRIELKASGGWCQERYVRKDVSRTLMYWPYCQ